MRVLLFTLVLLAFISCNDGTKQNMTETAVATTDSAAVKDEWIADFKKFRDAIYHNDRKTIKSFFDFPIMNENNEIWELAYLGEEIIPETQYERQIKPFNEAEFNERLSSIFPKHFIKSLMKVKTDSLLINGHYETIEFNEHDSFYYKMYVEIDSGKRLNLHLWSNQPIKIEDGEFDTAEFSILYEFGIINRKHLKFNRVRLAG